uniref:uncharacterized protein isoform X2 n=1 Tax=Pristiophorus japonicus TaxID=55135 RepID=UPI00398F8934
MASRTGRPAAFPGRVQFKKKLSTMRSMQRRMGGGPPVPSDMEQRVLGLVGKHPRTTTDATADPEVMPPQPAAWPHARPLSREGEGTGPDDPPSGAEEPRFLPVDQLGPFSTDDSADFEEPALPSSIMQSTPKTSSAPAAIPTSTVEVQGPFILPQGTRGISRTAPTKQRLARRGRSAPRAADLSGDMVDLSRRSVDIRQQTLQTMVVISQQMAIMTEYVSRMAEALEVIARNTGGRGLPVVPERGTAPQGAVPPLPKTRQPGGRSCFWLRARSHLGTVLSRIHPTSGSAIIPPQ